MANVGTNRASVLDNIDALNAIRNDASIEYQNYIPAITSAEEARQIGATIMSNPNLMNEFIKTIVNRIALVKINSPRYTNPLSVFKKGTIEFGETIEDIYVDIPSAHNYNPEEAESKVFAREFPNVKSAFYVENFEKFYKQTIQRKDIQRAFISATGVNDLETKIRASMDTALQRDEFLVTKYMLGKRLLDGRVKSTNIVSGSDAEATAKKLLTDIRRLGNVWATAISREYNNAGVSNVTPKANQYLIITAEYDAIIDVQALAYAFNMNMADLEQHKIVIDDFSTVDDTEINNLLGSGSAFTSAQKALLKKAVAVLVDEEYFQIYNASLDMSDFIKNPEGRYINYYLHADRIFNVSPFSQANVWALDNEPAITSVTATPDAFTLAKGQKAQTFVTVVASGFAPQTVTYEVSAEDMAKGLTCNSAGLITYAKDGTFEANDTATITVKSVFDTSKTDTITITFA